MCYTRLLCQLHSPLMYDLELIYWLDIASHKGGEWDTSPKSHGPVTCYTVGWVTEENNVYLTAHSTIAPPDGFGHDTVIPKGCIIQRKVLRKKYPKYERS